MKRSFDILFSISLFIILSPLFFFIYLLLLFLYGRPVIFSQIRAGKNGKPFKIFKFRTYKNNKNELSGIFALKLRKLKFDEMPQLFNIMKGEISFVGPRPLYVKYIKLYDNRQINRLNVKPGLTGLAQISGGNSLTWKKKFDYDLEYINKQNFLLDMIIIFKTVLLFISNLFNKSTNFKYSEQDDFKGN